MQTLSKGKGFVIPEMAVVAILENWRSVDV